GHGWTARRRLQGGVRTRLPWKPLPPRQETTKGSENRASSVTLPAAPRGYTCFLRTDQMNPSHQKCMMETTRVIERRTPTSAKTSAKKPYAPPTARKRAKVRGIASLEGPIRNRRVMLDFSMCQTSAKYWSAWKKFMMKNAWPN